MNFGDCSECGKYKYLEENSTCPTCLDSEWVVLRVQGRIWNMYIHKKDLSKKEAKSIAKDSTFLIAKPRDEAEEIIKNRR